MFSSNYRHVKNIATALGLRYNKKRYAAFGVYRGFTVYVTLDAADSEARYIQLVFYAAASDGTDRKTNFYDVPLPEKTEHIARGHYHALKTSLKGKEPQITERLVTAAETIIERLTAAGFVNCDYEGNIGATDIYVYDDSPTPLTAASADRLYSMLAQSQKEYDEIVENKLLGFIGALAGSAIGVLPILIFGRMGKVSAISSVVMGVAATLLYKKLGRKFSVFGSAVCIVLPLIFSYAAFRIDVALDLLTTFGDDADAGFGFFLENSKIIYAYADELGTYYQNMFLIILSSVIGSIVFVIIYYHSEKNQYTLTKLDGE